MLLNTLKRFMMSPGVFAATALVFFSFVGPRLFSSGSDLNIVVAVAITVGLVVLGKLYHGDWFRSVWKNVTSSNNSARTALFTLLISGSVLGAGCACGRVDQGYTGVMADLIGDDAGGVTELTPGRAFYNPVNKDLYIFPNFVQRVAWTETTEEGSPRNESIKVLSQDQLEFVLDVGFSYYVSKLPGCSKNVFVTYRADIGTITNGPLRDVVRKEIQDVFSQYEASSIYGKERPKVVDLINAGIVNRMSRIKSDSGEACFVIEDFAVLRLDPPKSIKTAVEEKIKATQMAEMERENLMKFRYQAQQESIRVAMEVFNNEALANSITPELVQWKQLEIMANKWNGQYPQVVGSDGAGLIIGLNK